MKGKRSLVLVSVLLVALAACSSKSKKSEFFEAQENPTRPKVTTITKLDRNWSVGLGSKVHKGHAFLSPAILGDNVYAASTKGKITKVELLNGKRVWTTSLKLKKEIISGGVGVGGGLVFVGTDEGVLYALKQEDGTVAWQAQLSSEILARPVTDGNMVLARTVDGRVYGVSAFDGNIEWTISRRPPSLTLRSESEPLLTQGIAFIGFPDGTVAALDAASGRALWDFPISIKRGTNELDGLADIDTAPVLVGEFIYVSSYQGVTHSLNVAQQSLAWTANVSSHRSMAYDAAYLYITDREGVVYQIDRNTGEVLWSQKGLQYFSVGSPISVGPYLTVSDGNGHLYVMKKSDGSYVGRHNLGAKSIVGDPIVDSDSIIFIDSNGRLQSLGIVTR